MSERLGRSSEFWTRYIVVLMVVFGLFFIYFLTLMPKASIKAKGPNESSCTLTAQRAFNMTDDEIKDFARLAVLKMSNFDYLNYHERLFDASKMFSPSARALFLAGRSPVAEEVRKNRITLKAIMTNEMQIEKTGVSIDGFRFWIVNVPVEVQSYIDIKGTPYSVEKVKMSFELSQDTPTKDNPYGLVITSLKIL